MGMNSYGINYRYCKTIINSILKKLIMNDFVNNRFFKRTLNLACLTIAYNIVEGIQSIFAGLNAGSISLVDFELEKCC
jgi:hypothetical protein